MISPGQYNIFSEHIMRGVLEEHHDGITIGGRRETNLRFADDTTLLCTIKEDLLGLLRKAKEASMSPNLFVRGLMIKTRFRCDLPFVIVPDPNVDPAIVNDCFNWYPSSAKHAYQDDYIIASYLYSG